MSETYKTLEEHDICRALEQDVSNAHLAREFGVHKETIVSWRRKFGIPRFVSRAECQELTLELLRADREHQGVCLAELVSYCHASRQKLYWILKDMERAGLIYALGSTNARRWYLSP